MKRPLGIGIIGAGGIARARHLPNLAALEGVQVLALARRTIEGAQETAREFDVPRATGDWREILAMDDVDAVIIGTWPYLHCEATLAVLDAGKHVLCESRMAMNYDEARQMDEASRASDRVTMLCPPPTALEGDWVMKELIAAGYLGELRDVHVTALTGAFADAEVPLHWRQRPEFSGCNVLTLGMWVEVAHRWVGYHSHVLADMKTFIAERTDPATGQRVPIRYPDTIGVLAELECGAHAVYHFSGVAQTPPHNRFELYGSEGTLIYDINDDRIFGAKAGEDAVSEIAITPGKVRGWRVESDFIEAIRAQEAGQSYKVSPDFYEGLKYMEFTEAVWKSAEAARPISLPLA